MHDAQRPVLATSDRVILVIALILPTAITYLYFLRLNGAPLELQRGAYGIGKTVQFALPAFWVLLVRRQFPTFRSPQTWSLIVGVLFGLAVAAGMAGLYLAL